MPADRTHHLRRPRGLRNYNEEGLDALDSLIETGSAFVAKNPGWFKAEVAKAQPDDVAAMFFTSGTTGNPKGVVHTHSTLLDRATAGAEFDKLTSSEEVLAYLPPPGLARTSSATPSGWPAATWSTAPSRPAPSPSTSRKWAPPITLRPRIF